MLDTELVYQVNLMITASNGDVENFWKPLFPTQSLCMVPTSENSFMTWKCTNMMKSKMMTRNDTNSLEKVAIM